MSRRGSAFLGTMVGVVLVAALIGSLSFVIKKSPKIDVAKVTEELAPLTASKGPEAPAPSAVMALLSGSSTDASSTGSGSSSTPDAVSGIEITSPKGGDIWQADKENKLTWTGGGPAITLFLINKAYESDGISASIAGRVYNVKNTGEFEYKPHNLYGTFRWYVTDENGSAYSEYFEIR